MVNRELIEVFSEIAREKNVERSELAAILEELFLYVIEKEYGDSSNCSCIVNLDKGEIEIYAEKTIVDEIDDYKVEITLEEAIEKEPDASDLEVGDVFVEVIDPRVFGRRLVVTAKQFFAQRLRDLERNYIYEDYDADILQRYLDGLKQLDEKELQPSFIIFDDIQGVLSGQDKVLTSLNACHRHFKISIFYCFQYIYGHGSTPVLRECTTLAFLFNSKGKRTLEALFENFGQLFDNFKQFKEYFLACTKEKYTAMLYIQDVDNIDENYLQYKAPPPKQMKHTKNIKLAY